MLNTGLWKCRGKSVVKLIENHHRFGAGIIKLMDQFTMGIHRVGVNYNQTQLPGGNDNNRVLQQIG